MAAADLYAAAAELLAASGAALAASPGGAIARAFVSPGPPAWDCCPQLTVHAGGAVAADTAMLQPPLQPGHRIDQGILVNLVPLTITVLRCTPIIEGEGQKMRLPEPADLDAAAAMTIGDLWAIWNWLAARKRDETLFPPDSRELFFDPAVALNTAGGCSGWEIQVRVTLGGYQA